MLKKQPNNLWITFFGFLLFAEVPLFLYRSKSESVELQNIREICRNTQNWYSPCSIYTQPCLYKALDN